MSIQDAVRLGLMVVFLLFAGGAAHALQIKVQADQTQVPMGRTAVMDVAVTRDDGSAAPGCTVLPYVNGRRWGAHETTDASGRVQIPLPFPNPGTAQVRM